MVKKHDKLNEGVSSYEERWTLIIHRKLLLVLDYSQLEINYQYLGN